MFSVGGTVSTLFQSTRPVRGATAIFLTTFSITGNFNPRAPCGARRKTRRCCCQARNFNPRAPCGARQDGAGGERCPEDFNPRAPCGARRDTKAAFAPSHEFQSTRPVRGATVQFGTDTAPLDISIHAPRAGRDARSSASVYWRRNFNPRAPCGARRVGKEIYFRTPVFQSTRPVRGATRCRASSPLLCGNFNPRAPCGARPSMAAALMAVTSFQSTRPVRGATLMENTLIR